MTMDNDAKSKNQISKIKNGDGGKQLDGEKREEELKRKVEELDEKYKRALADYQNLEKRVTEERKDWVRKSNKELLLRILPVLDTLMVASNHVKDEGLTLSIKQFLDILKLEGVEKIETNGKQFDPKLMRCVDTKVGQDGIVLEEIRSGYIYKVDGTLLREADVIVGKERTEKQEEEKAKEQLGKGDYM